MGYIKIIPILRKEIQKSILWVGNVTTHILMSVKGWWRIKVGSTSNSHSVFSAAPSWQRSGYPGFLNLNVSKRLILFKESLSLVWISQRKLMHDTGVVFMPVLQSHHNRKLRLSPVKGGRRELLNSWFRLLFAPSSPIIRSTFISQHFCHFFNHQVK